MLRRSLQNRVFLVLVALPVLLIGATSWLTCVQMRRERLDRQLVESADRQDTAAVSALLASGASANSTDDSVRRDGSLWQVVLRALGRRSAENGKPVLVVAMGTGNAECVRLLLAHAADLRPVDVVGRGVLEWAAAKGHVDVADLALKRGVPIDVRNERGGTPLLAAALDGSPEIVRYLIQRGADVNAQDEDGCTALTVALGKPDKMRLLLDHGAGMSIRDSAGRTLMKAAVDRYRGSEPSVELLISRGADANMTDWDGRTPLMWAAAYGNDPVVTILLKHGADVRRHDAKGATALSLARATRSWGCVRLLRAAGVRE